MRQEFARAPAEIRRLAIGDPAAVPAGVYARRYLEQRGLWTAYEPRIVPTTNVRAALAAVETGSVDAAIVYVTDLAAARTRGSGVRRAGGRWAAHRVSRRRPRGVTQSGGGAEVSRLSASARRGSHLCQA